MSPGYSGAVDIRYQDKDHQKIRSLILYVCNYSVLSLEEETFSAAGYNLLSHDASVVDQVSQIQ